MLKEVGMESVHSQNDHHPDMEARTERIATVSDSELEEPGTASPEPNGQRCREEHTSKRVEQLSVESVNDTGQQESSVGSDRVLNSVDCGSSLFKTIDSKDTSGQPDHSMASKGSNASGGISMESGASTDGPQNPPLHKDTADVLEHTERPHDLSGQQLNTISLKEVCHQEDKATGVKEVCKQPGYSPESKEIHDQTDNTSKSTETSHQPKNTKEIDTINDPQNMAREHEETANQPHNTIEREESADQAHNTTEMGDTIDQPHNTMEREDTTDQPRNTTETEDTFDQPHNTTEMDETTDQPHNTTEGEQTTDQPHNTTERDETADQQHNTTERKETADQPQKTTKREETADQPHISTEREETADLPHNTMKREKTADQADHVLRSMKNTNKAHNTSTRVCDQAENTTKSEISDYSDTFNGQANSTGGSIEVCEERSCASNTSVHEQPNNSMGIKEMGDQQPNAREYAKISDLLQTTIERGEISDEPLCMMELNEMNEQPKKSTSSEENHVQPHSVTNCETIYNQVLKSTESKGVIDNSEQSAEVNEIGDQTHTITESKGIDNQAGTNEESKEPSDKVYHTTESEDFNYPDRTKMSNGISTQSANITEPKDIRYKPENTMETIEVSVRSVTGRQMAKKIDQPENIPDSEENGDKPDHLMGPKRISEESEKAEMSFEIGDHSADTAMSPEIGNQGDDSSEAGENSDQSVKVAETKDTIEQSEKGILSMEISDQTKNILKCEDHSDQSPDNIESKVINNQSDDPGRSEGISEEPGIIMDSRERSHEAGTTNGTGNSDRLANTVEVFGSNSEAITIVNSAESIDQSNRTNDPLSVRLDDPIYNVSSKDLNIVSCTEVESNESCQGSPNNKLNRGSRDICHIDAPSRLEYDGFPKHTDPLESTGPEILGAQVPGLTNAGTISSHNIEMNETRASTHYSNGPPEAHDQPDTTREEAETKDKPNKSLDHQGPHIVHDHNPEDESNIQHPTGFMDAQHSTAASPPQAESPHEPYRRDSEVQTALDSEIERQLACLLESNMRNTPQSNPRGMSPEETLPAACVGFKGKEGDPLGQDDETTYLYERKNDRSMSSTEASATQDATLAHCVTGTPSSELWEIPSQCLPPDEQFVEDDSKAPSTGASPPSNSHHTDLDPEACSGSVGLDTVRCQIEWTQHPEATPEISSLSIPSALLLQSNRPSGVAEEAVLFEDVRTMDCTSSFHLSDVDYSMWASDGQRDVAFQPYGEDDTVSPSLQVGHVCDATESKAPAKGDQCENKLQKDISQTPKSPNPEHFSRPEPDLEVVPTKRDISEQEGSIPGSEHPPFTSDTNDEEPAYDTLLVERYRYAEDVPDGNPTLVNPSASEDELTLQRASHEHAFTEGLQAPVCLRAPQAETDSSLNLNSGDVFPLDSGTDPDLPYEGLISKSWPIDPAVGGFNEVEETNSGRYVGEGHREAHEVPVRIHPYGFKVDFTKFHSLVPPPLQGADEEVHKPPAASNPDLDKAGYEVLAAAEVVHHLPLGEDSNVDTSSGWESDLSITDTSSSPIKSQMPRPLHFYNLFKWHEHSRPSRSFSEEVTVEPQDVHAGLWSPVNPRVLLNSLPVTLPNDGSVLGAETSPIPDLSPASENVFLSPQVKFAPVTVIAGTAEPKTQSNWVPTWKVPDDSVLQALTRKIGSPKLGRRTCKVYRTRGGSDAGEIRHRQSTPFLISHIGLPEEKVPAETAVREPDRLPSLTTKVFKISPKPAHTKAFFKQAAVSEDAGPNAEEDLPSAAQGTFEAALPAQGMDNSTSDPVQLRKRHDPFTSSNIVRRHSKLINSSRQLYQEYSDEALNQAIERQKRGETFLEEPEPSSPRLRRKLMSTPDSYLQRLSVSSSAALWQDIPMIRGTSALLSMTREEQKLQEAKFELIMSEASYLRSLNIAVDHFQHSPELQTLLSNQERQWLFSRLQEVRDVSSNFLYDLEEKFEDNMYTFNVCDVVLSHAADFRKVYLPYVTNQSYQDQTFQRLLSGNPRFQQVLAKLESDPVCQRLSLKSFLILPFQRITRLKLLVQNILKRTRPGSREEAPATQAYSLLEQLIKDCNENVQRMRSTEELIYLSQKIEFECKIFPLISQSRRLVKQGELLELESSTPLSFKWKVITRPIYLHLFNDCLLLSRRREGARFLVFDHARVSKVQGEKCEMKMHGNSKNIFRLILQENNQGRKVEFLLRTETQSEKLRWIAALAHHKKKPDFLQCHDNPQVQCLKSYKAREHDELSLEKADVLMVAQQSKDGWMEGTRLSDGEHGWFPVENVEDISNKHVRLRNLKEEQRVQHARAKLIPPHHQR